MGNMGMVNLFYDDGLNITWLGDANLARTSGFDADGLMTWADAVMWADDLTVGSFTDWRLPVCLDNATSSENCGPPDSEMAHLFNVEGISTGTPSPFSNVQDSFFYWSETEDTFSTNFAWTFAFTNSSRISQVKSTEYFAWAVRDGDVAPVPVPGTMLLMGSGLLGLLGWRHLRRG